MSFPRITRRRPTRLQARQYKATMNVKKALANKAFFFCRDPAHFLHRYIRKCLMWGSSRAMQSRAAHFLRGCRICPNCMAAGDTTSSIFLPTSYQSDPACKASTLWDTSLIFYRIFTRFRPLISGAKLRSPCGHSRTLFPRSPLQGRSV